MRRFAILLLALCPALLAQSLADPGHLDAIREAFDFPQAAPSLECQFTPVRPALDFSFRFRTGYVMHTPLGQFHGKGRGWTVLLQVKPEAGEPTFLVHTFHLPDVPDTRLLSEAAGGFLVGEGKYRVQAVVDDDQHRGCRAQWNIEAKLDSAERKLTQAMPTGSVAEITSPPSSLPAAVPKLGRLTILLHAAPLSPRQSKLQARDVSMLVGSLSTLMKQLPARSMRLVVFNLEQQSVLLSKDGFTSADIDAVTKAANEIQLSMVDYKTLQNAGGSVGLLATLIRAELQASEPSDEVVFLGPLSRTRKPVAKDDFEKSPRGAPRIYYVQYLPLTRTPGGRLGSANAIPAGMGRAASFSPIPPIPDFTASDSIEQAVGRLKGDTIMVRTPADFANAIRRMTPTSLK
jgi:hypothetical protein